MPVAVAGGGRCGAGLLGVVAPGAGGGVVGAAPDSGTSTTAVPYATISDIVPASSDESNRNEMIAFAPTMVAFWTIRSIAWRRVSSRRLVYSWISPPPSERSPAITLPPIPRLRTTRPNTWPFVSTTRQPAT